MRTWGKYLALLDDSRALHVRDERARLDLLMLSVIARPKASMKTSYKDLVRVVKGPPPHEPAVVGLAAVA